MELRPDSTAVHSGRPPAGPRVPLNPPIVMAAPFHAGPDTNYYLRGGSSDTVRAFEQVVGDLEGGRAVAFASGMAATSALVEGQPVGTVAVAPHSGYWGTSALFTEQQRLGRMGVRSVDIADTAAVVEALDGAHLLWLETISNPLLNVPDLPALIDAAHDRGALVVVDATFTPPPIARCLGLGADAVMHSATKYLAGHSDLVMGVLVSRNDDLVARFEERRGLTGAVPGGLEAYLALRGVRTLSLRMHRAQQNALELATRLSGHPKVAAVRYPGLPADPGHERASTQYQGFGAVVAFELGSVTDADAVCTHVELITHATSLGGVESLIERRAMYEGEATRGTPPTLLRLSVGIEHVEDLWADLEQALRSAG